MALGFRIVFRETSECLSLAGLPDDLARSLRCSWRVCWPHAPSVAAEQPCSGARGVRLTTGMPIIEACLAANRAWAARTRAADPGYFERLCHQQRPDLLWIGCSDSRLMPTEITGRAPGEVFVHRNIANQVVPGDANGHAVLGYALEVLGVREVVVCGHYGCGGVQAALQGRATGVVGLWIEHLRAVQAHHRGELSAIGGEEARADRLAELNVLAQADNVARSAAVREAWARGQPVRVHAWIYALRDGLLRPLRAPINGVTEKESNPQFGPVKT